MISPSLKDGRKKVLRTLHSMVVLKEDPRSGTA